MKHTTIKPKSQMDIDITKSHIHKLIGLSVLTKLVLVILTVFVFHSFIDTFALDYYYQHAQLLVQGQIPYISYSYEYPVLSWIPVLVAYIPALLLHSETIFVFVFIGLMCACDIVTAICVYKIGLSVWNNHKQAFIASILYVTAISVAYVTMTEYAAFATMLLAIGLLFTISKKEKIVGYTSIAIGLFTKAYPIIAMPFIVLYNAKTTSLKQELISAFKIFGAAIAILFLPFYLYNQSAIDTYLFRINGESRDIFASSVTYLTHGWTNSVFKLPISTGTISTLFLVIFGIIVIALIYVMYKSKSQDPKLLLKVILVTIFGTVTVMQFHSPNYDAFYIIPLCLLCVDDIRTIILLYFSQFIAFIVFPLSFYSLWGNTSYTGEIGSLTWDLALILFTIQFIVLLTLVWIVVNPRQIYADLKHG